MPCPSTSARSSDAARRRVRELFVYYRVRPVDAEALARAVAAMQAGLRERHPGLSARLLRRDDAAAETETWMETYASTLHSGIDAALEAEIDAAARPLLALIDGTRHLERFDA